MSIRLASSALALALLAAPLAAQGQLAGRLPRVGVLGNVRLSITDGYERGFKELGYEDGKNVIIEWRLAQGNLARLPALAAELVQLKVDVILAANEAYVNIARQATATIPIVFCIVSDPVAAGYVASFRRPGGSITGLSSMWYQLTGKRLEILKEVVPRAEAVAVLTQPIGAPGYSPLVVGALKTLEEEARALGSSLQIHMATEAGELENTFATMTRQGARSLMMLSSTPLLYAERKRIADLAIRYRLPTMCEFREAVEAGCLLSYAASPFDLGRRAVGYVDRILKGASPADLPVEQPTKFEFLVNLKTAKTLGLTIPPSVLARADEVIQ